MSATIDFAPLEAARLGIRTVGDALTHVQRNDRLVVRLLIDGIEPAPETLPDVRKWLIDAHTLFMETADPKGLAGEILTEVDSQLAVADRFKDEAADCLRKSQWAFAMEKLAGCFSVWQTAQQAIVGTAQLLRLDLSQIDVDGMPVEELLSGFAEQLRSIRSALESRDFVLLTDLLVYETTHTSAQWRSTLQKLQSIAGGA